jgi:hypothetical protein
MRNALIAAIALTTATTAGAGLFSDCDHTAPRSLSSPTSGITKIVVVGHQGTLKVEGRAGVAEMRASGTACASSDSLLSDVTLRASRSGSELRVEAIIPEDLFSEEASLDFAVTVPNNIAISVEDGSGSLEISGTATLDVTDGSGELSVKNVNGDVTITDGSGSIDVADVSGRVRITDGSGSIDVVRAGAVTVAADGSGSVHVSDIRGDFFVGVKGSGSIDYERVAGKVDVPTRERDGRRGR